MGGNNCRFEGRTDISSKINVRDAFVGRAGKMLLSADYVQCEIRILAHLSNDSKLIALLQDPEACPYVSVASCVTGKPTSSVTAMERSTFKTVMLGLVYGVCQPNQPEETTIRLRFADREIIGSSWPCQIPLFRSSV